MRKFGEIDKEIIEELMCLMRPLDAYLRDEHRRVVVETVLSMGIKVHAFHRGWELYDGKGKENIVVHDAVSFSEGIRILSNGKVILSNLPLFADGSHERALNALAQKSICLQDKNKWFSDNFREGEGMLYYNMKHPDEIVDKVTQILEHKIDVESAAEKGNQKVVSGHLWKHRADKIIRIVEELY